MTYHLGENTTAQDVLNEDTSVLRQEIEDTFTPWHKDPLRIAALLRWLEQREQAPIDIPAFIETAIAWEQDYRDLQMWSGRG